MAIWSRGRKAASEAFHHEPSRPVCQPAPGGSLRKQPAGIGPKRAMAGCVGAHRRSLAWSALPRRAARRPGKGFDVHPFIRFAPERPGGGAPWPLGRRGPLLFLRRLRHRRRAAGQPPRGDHPFRPTAPSRGPATPSPSCATRRWSSWWCWRLLRTGPDWTARCQAVRAAHDRRQHDLGRADPPGESPRRLRPGAARRTARTVITLRVSTDHLGRRAAGPEPLDLHAGRHPAQPGQVLPRGRTEARSWAAAIGQLAETFARGLRQGHRPRRVLVRARSRPGRLTADPSKQGNRHGQGSEEEQPRDPQAQGREAPSRRSWSRATLDPPKKG